jgi:hypothetical protein
VDLDDLVSDLKRCTCHRNDTCHFCGESTKFDEMSTDDSVASCDFVMHGDLLIMAHWYCAEGQPGVERG